MAKEKLKVAFVTGEITGFASTGGLGDVAKALPEELKRSGVEAIRIMPLYRIVRQNVSEIKPSGRTLSIPMGKDVWHAEVWESTGKGVKTFFINKEECFDRDGLYTLENRPFDDNFERFLLFQKAVVALLDVLKFKADIVHCNDWHTGLIPLLLRYGIDGAGRKKNEKILFSIHNLAYQGLFPDHKFELTNLPGHTFTHHHLEYFGQLNCMKTGIADSDWVSTVSETYAREIQTPEFGVGLEPLLQFKANKLTGIVNGVDYNVWNPSKDPHIASAFKPSGLAGKEACKKAIVKEFKLKYDPTIPLIGMVSRMTDQKGFDVIATSMPKLMSRKVQLIILGSGESRHHEYATKWAEKWPDKVGVHIGFDNPQAHRIEAGADFFLMPSQFEPCGLNQMYSLKYGTIPIVNDTGGLSDTIIDLSLPGGTGFKMIAYTAKALDLAIQRAMDLYAQPVNLNKVRKTGMKKDFSWKTTAQAYISLYEKLLAS
ncbi:MAG: starch synthase [Kiritimatiellia bacterium]|jgi:starch synthase